MPRGQNFSKILIKSINLNFLIPSELEVCLPTPIDRYFSNLATPTVRGSASHQSFLTASRVTEEFTSESLLKNEDFRFARL